MQGRAGIPAQSRPRSRPRKIAAFEILWPLSHTNNPYCHQPSASIGFLALNYETTINHNRSRGAGGVWGVATVGSSTRNETSWPGWGSQAPNNLIHKAAEEGNIEAVKQHLAAGWDVNAKDEDGWTPLYYATTEEIAGLLIAKGADVNAKAEDGNTPMCVETGAANKKIIELLIAEGADVNPNDFHTPLDRVIIYDNTEIGAEIIDLLRKHGAKTVEELKAKCN